MVQLLTAEALRGRTDLLVLQASPFCNLDCSYCYLPDRANKTRMQHDTVAAAVDWVVSAGLAREQLTIAWHAGEPLAVPPGWYRSAFATAERAAAGRCTIGHAFQTNATLIDDRWCDLFDEVDARVGVSIDGPAALHDACRRTRRGKGTHAAAMRGVECLHRRGIPFHAIAVVSARTVEHGDAFIDFFERLPCTELGLNFEEQEGANTSSSLVPGPLSPPMRDFLRRLVERAASTPALQLREMRSVVQMLRDPGFGERHRNQENTAFAIVTVDASGDVFTYSPELAGQRHSAYADFRLGNVHLDTLQSVLDSVLFRRLERDIAAGVARCEDECKYFHLCLGGAPSNKIAELDSFVGTQTTTCQHAVMGLGDIVLEQLERDLVRGRKRPARG